MAATKIFCPGGASSQTGTAGGLRYPGVPIENCGKIPEVLNQLEKNDGPFVVPVWNSHEGEVLAASQLWDSIRESKTKITDIWPKSINFWLVRRKGEKTTYGKIGSVVVARTQCLGFLKKENATLVPCALTTVAFDEYKSGAEWDGVLLAPGGVEEGFEVVHRETANPNNFTSFVALVPPTAFKVADPAHVSWLTGITMGSFGEALGDDQQEVFEHMFSSSTDIGHVPKLIFVLKRVGKVGLLFEGVRMYAGDLIDAEALETGDISVYEEVGATASKYTSELLNLFRAQMPVLCGNDFILHRGVNTCFFACPPLDIYTHGYEVETVEPVVRFFIGQMFQLWNNGAGCTSEQEAFFSRHADSWRDNGSAFITFTEIAAHD